MDPRRRPLEVLALLSLLVALCTFALPSCLRFEAQTEDNRLPVPSIEVAPGEAVHCGAVVTLDGSGSTDPDPQDRAGLTLLWQQTQGQPVLLDDPEAAEVHFRAPEQAGLLAFVLHVSDGIDTVRSSPLVIAVENDAPLAHAAARPEGPVAGGQTVTLDASGTRDPDPEDQEGLQLRWEQIGGEAVMLDSTSALEVHFEAPRLRQALLFQLHVSDGRLSSTSSPLRVEVVNRPPVPAVALDPGVTVSGGVAVTLDASGTEDPDPLDGPLLQYTWTQVAGDAVALDGQSTATARFTAPRRSQTLLFSLQVSDSVNTVSAPLQRVEVVNLEPPSADAGPDQLVSMGELVLLDARGSSDPDSDALTYRWEQVSGVPVALADADAPVTTFGAPLEPGQLVFRVEVSDGERVDEDGVMVEVKEAPQARIALGVGDGELVDRSGQVVTVGADQLLLLDATGSEPPPGSVLSGYQWLLRPEMPVGDEELSSPVVSFVSPRQGTVILVELQVQATLPLDEQDGIESEPTRLTIVVNPAPEVDAGPDQAVSPGSVVRLDGANSEDPDGEPLVYLWSQLSGPEVELAGRETAQVSFTAPEENVRLELQLEVSDGVNTAQDQVVIEVREMPEAHILLGVDGEGVRAATGETVTLADGTPVLLDGGASSPPPGCQIVGYRWSSRPELALTPDELAQPALSFVTPLEPTVLMIQLVVLARREGDVGTLPLESAPARLSLVVRPPPVARPGPPRQTLNRVPMQLDGSQSEGAIAYRWRVLAAPPGGECCLHDGGGCAFSDDDGQRLPCLSGATTPSPNFTPFARGSHTIELVVVDRVDVESAPAFLVVSSLNNPPRARAGADRSTRNHEPVSLQVAYSDPDDDRIEPGVVPGTEVSWEVRGLPEGATYELTQEAGDLLRWELTPHGKGAYFLELVVHDGQDPSEPDALLVLATNTPPLAAPVPEVEGRNRAPLRLSAGESRDADGDPLRYHWTVVTTPPGGAARIDDPRSVAPLLLPDGKGIYEIELVVSDGEAEAEPVSVTAMSRNNPPVADAGADLLGVTQRELTLHGGQSSDPDDDAIVGWRWRQLAGPGLELAGEDGPQLRLRFEATGAYRFGLTVSDGEDSSAEAAVSVQVSDLNGPPVLDPLPLAYGPAGGELRLAASATDPEGDTIRSYHWTRLSDHPTLPAELLGEAPLLPLELEFDVERSDRNRIVYEVVATDERGARSLPAEQLIRLTPDPRSWTFVSDSGEDTADCGTPASPCRSIVQGITRSAAPERGERPRRVLVTGRRVDGPEGRPARYPAPTRSLVVPYGVTVSGGWDPVTFERDPARIVTQIEWPGAAPAEIMDLADNDCDGWVDESEPSGPGELCNNTDDNGDGTVDEGCPDRLNLPPGSSPEEATEPNDSPEAAVPIEFGRSYVDLYVRHESPDWFRFTLPVDLPGDPDGPDGPLPAPYVLRVDHREPRIDLTGGNRGPRTVGLYAYRDEQLEAIDVRSGTRSITLSSSGPLPAGDYLISVSSSQQQGTGLSVHCFYDFDLYLAHQDGAGEPVPGPECRRAAATVYVPPPGEQGGTPLASEAPVLEGLRIVAPPDQVEVDDEVHFAAGIYCDGCVMRVRRSELIGEGTLGTEAAAIWLASTGSVRQDAGGPTAPGVLIEDSRIVAPWSTWSAGVRVVDAQDLLLQGCQLEARVPAGVSRVALVDVEGEQTGALRAELRSSVFRLEGPESASQCAGVRLNEWAQIWLLDNVFEVRSFCAQDHVNHHNAAIFQAGGAQNARVVVANNLILGDPAAAANSAGYAQSTAGTVCLVTGVLRNNYLETLAYGISDCSHERRVVQRNVFSEVGLGSPDGFAYQIIGWDQVTQDDLAAAEQGALGPNPASLHNVVGACSFVERDAGDWTAAPGSPCLDQGSIADDLPDGFPWDSTLLAADARGQRRPVDLPEVGDPAGDGTDVGPVERQGE